MLASSLCSRQIKIVPSPLLDTEVNKTSNVIRKKKMSRYHLISALIKQSGQTHIDKSTCTLYVTVNNNIAITVT